MASGSRQDRREFLRGVVRAGLAGALVGGIGRLVLRAGGCARANACAGCPTLAGCDLPQATSARSRPAGKGGGDGR